MNQFLKDHPEYFMFFVMLWASFLWFYAMHVHSDSAVQLTWGVVNGAFGSILTLITTNSGPKGP